MHRHWLLVLCLSLSACERRETEASSADTKDARLSARVRSEPSTRDTPPAPASPEEQLARLARKHPSQALALVIEQAHGDEAVLRKGLAIVLDEMIGDYLDRPTDLFMQILKDGSPHIEYTDNWIYLGEVTKAFTRRDPDKAYEFLKVSFGEIVDPFGTFRGQAMFSQLVESRGFAGAIDFFHGHVPEASSWDLVSVLLPQRQPLTPEMVNGTLALLDHQSTSADFEEKLGHVAQPLANSAVDAFSTWLEQQPQDDRYAPGYRQVAASLARKGRLEEAAIWIKRIADPEKRQLAKDVALSAGIDFNKSSSPEPSKPIDDTTIETIRKTLDGNP
ncbi:MAG: hypothetical protein QM755_02175 [Luteolibacter sp.]